MIDTEFFIIRGYETEEARGGLNSNTWVLQIKISPETVNFQPDGSVRNLGAPTQNMLPVTIKSTPNRDGSGIFPRGVVVRWTESAPEGYATNGTIFVPVLRRNRYHIYRLGQRVRYLGGTGIIVSKLPETLRN